MTTTTQRLASAPPEPAPPHATPVLTDRLAVLDRLVELGTGRIDQGLLADTAALLGRAGDRLLLSGEHTIVALAGGTGSGKSSLFNAVCGLELSPTGMRRPMTSSAHACVWGLDGATPLLDWLGIDKRHRYARASALDQVGSEPQPAGRLDGLVLLDLPDHDSVRAAHRAEVDRYVSVADLFVWVLDPQKYADFAVHRRYLEPLSGHTGVTLIVLNQVDRLEPEEAGECVNDLRRLLEAEGMRDPRILTTSAVSGGGIDGFHEVLAETVAAHVARVDRLAADIDGLAARYANEYGDHVPPDTVDDRRTASLVEALADATGVPAVAEAMQSAYELRALDYVGWPPGRLAAWLRGDPLRRMRLIELRDELHDTFTSPVNAQQAHVDNALRDVAGEVTEHLPPSWRRSVRDAGRSNAEALPEALGASLRGVAPAFNQIPRWWWAIRVCQLLLLVVAGLGLVWLGAILAMGVLKLAHAPLRILADTAMAPYAALFLLCALGLGALTSVAARGAISLSSVKHSRRMEKTMREAITATARSMVIEPVERELAVYAHFRDAAGNAVRSISG